VCRRLRLCRAAPASNPGTLTATGSTAGIPRIAEPPSAVQWGVITQKDRWENERAPRKGLRPLSAYLVEWGERLWPPLV
jgi:hypothetical protein